MYNVHVRSGAKWWFDGWSPLKMASEKGHDEVVMALIVAGAEVSLTNKVV